MTAPNGSRRDFVKRGAYVTPAILTLAAAPEFAKAGSVKPTPPRGGPGRGDDDGPGRGRGDDGPGRGHGPGRGRGDDGPGRGHGRP